MTALVFALRIPGAHLDQLLDQIRPGVAAGASLPAGAVRRREHHCTPCRRAAPPAQIAARRP